MSAPAPAPPALPTGLRIARSGALLGAGVAVAQVLSFFTGLLVTKQLGAEYGSFIGAQRFAGLFRTIADLGLAVVVVRAVAAGRPDAGAVYGTVLGLRCVSALLFAAVVLLAAYLVDYLPTELPVLCAFIALHAFDVLGETGNALLEGRERMGRAALIQVIRAGALLLAVGAAVQGAAGLRGFSAAYAACSALQCGAAIALAASLRPPLRPRLEAARAPALLRESSLYVLIAAAYTLLRSLDVVLLTRFAGPAETARYGAALNLVDAALILPALAQRALLPAFSRADGGAHEPVCAQTLCLVSALFTPFAAGLAVLAPEAIALYGEPAFDGAQGALRGLAGLVPLSAAATVAGAYLTGAGRAASLLVVYAGALPLFGLGCAAALASGAGASAMALAALLGQALLSAGALFAAARRGVQLPWAAAARHVALSALMAAGVWALRGRAPLPLTVLAGALGYAAALYLLSPAASPERHALSWIATRLAARLTRRA